ncbi:MAG: hypothetical protein ACYC7E_19330 [Armatimonadota bacterium]
MVTGMARVVMLLVGLVMLALGVLGCIFFWDAVWRVVVSLIIVALVLLGLLVVVLAVSEFAGPRNEQAATEATPESAEEGDEASA